MPISGTASARSLARQFAGAAAALAAIAVLLVAAGSWWWTDRLQRESVRLLQQKDVDLRAAQVGDTLVLIQDRLAELAASPLLATALTDSVGRDTYVLPYVGSLQTINAVPLELLFVDFQGEEIARNGDLTLAPAQRQALQRLLAEGRSGAVLSPAAAGDEVLFAAVVRYPRTHTVEGALWAKVRLGSLLRDGDYRLLPEPGPAAGADAASGDGPIAARVLLPATLQGLDFRVVRSVAPEVPAPGGPLALLLLAATGLLVLAVGVLGQRLARRLTAELSALDTFAREVAERAFGSARAPVRGAQEVASLAVSINRMLDRLNEQHASLQDQARNQLHLLATCIEHLNDVVMITDAPSHGTEGGRGHRIVFVNEAFVRLTGYRRDEVIGRTPKLLQGPLTDRGELDRVAASLARWQPVRAELLNYTKAGATFWVEMEIVPVRDASGWVTHWVSVERDATARREAEATRHNLELQVREAQKMEAIGTLAGGIAHDFNNILGAILGSLALARQELDEGRPATERLEQIGRSAGRARTLVQQILAFSRRQAPAREPQALAPLIEETVALLRATVPARVHLRTTLPAEPLVVLGDGVALEQVLMNLATNAWQALQGSTGTVGVGLEAVTLAEGSHEALTPGRYAHLWVSDDGCGMDAATQQRIFEPFFTTKAVGSGTGLGLAVVLGIVRAHGGAITLDSAPGRGSVFHVHLPLADLPPPARGAAGDEGAVHGATKGAGEHVLYLDDDEVMVAVAEALLQRWGYRVTALRSAAAAIEAVRAQPGAWDVVITDFNMPGLSGLEVLRALREIRPALPVILTSGYIVDEVRDEALAAGASALLRKENLQDELAALLARVLHPQ